MTERRNMEHEVLITLGCVAVCVLFALLMTGREATRTVMDGTAAFLSPFEKPAIYAVARIERARRWMTDRHKLLLELTELREQNRQLRLKFGTERADEFHRAFRQDRRYLVVYRDPRAWWDEMRIECGADEFPVGSAALDGSNLVGVVSAAGADGVWVQLLSNSELYVLVVVEATREIGVVTGDSEGGVWLKFLPSEGGYTAGMEIVTVLGGTLPAGIPVGVLTDERRVLTPGIEEYRIRPGADLFRLQSVHIMKGKER